MHGTSPLLSRVWMDTHFGYCEKCLSEQWEEALTEELSPFTLSVYFYMLHACAGAGRIQKRAPDPLELDH